MDFGEYELAELAQTPGGVYDLADGLLREIALQFGVFLGSEPTVGELQRLIGAVGPAKTLQDNIAHAQSILGSDAVHIAADWLERSGVMEAVYGAFSAPIAKPPEKFDAAVLFGGVANWMFRRMMLLARLDPRRAGKVIWACGNRKMGRGEHQFVENYVRVSGELPTEHDFVYSYIAPFLEEVEFDIEVLKVGSTSGNDVCAAAVEKVRDALEGTVLVVGNAPSTIQSAGQFLEAARQINDSFDEDGDQLYMVGDYFPLARYGESKDTHQHPVPALCALIRDALFLHKSIAA